jgi:hypothetical protein
LVTSCSSRSSSGPSSAGSPVQVGQSVRRRGRPAQPPSPGSVGLPPGQPGPERRLPLRSCTSDGRPSGGERRPGPDRPRRSAGDRSQPRRGGPDAAPTWPQRLSPGPGRARSVRERTGSRRHRPSPAGRKILLGPGFRASDLVPKLLIATFGTLRPRVQIPPSRPVKVLVRPPLRLSTDRRRARQTTQTTSGWSEAVPGGLHRPAALVEGPVARPTAAAYPPPPDGRCLLEARSTLRERKSRRPLPGAIRSPTSALPRWPCEGGADPRLSLSSSNEQAPSDVRKGIPGFPR